MKEHIIFDNTNINDEDYRKEFEEWCDINGLDTDEEDFDGFVQNEMDRWLEAEYANLSYKPCGTILAIADLGFWNGRRSDYKLICRNKLNGIFGVFGSDYGYFKFYCDRYQLKATLHHHDGTHYLTFYEVREGKNIQPLLDKIYEGEEVTNKEINRYCRGLRPKVAKIYGW